MPPNYTVLVGRAPFGPICQAVLISNFGDYQRTFGELSLDSTMSYAVNDFFQNGGGQAVIVRLYRPQGSSPYNPPSPLVGAAGFVLSSSSVIPGLTFSAATPGA